MRIHLESAIQGKDKSKCQLAAAKGLKKCQGLSTAELFPGICAGEATLSTRR